MIFVTVGTHEQPFDRLIYEIDRLKKIGEIQEDVIMQTGYSTYEPLNCKFSSFIAYSDMIENMKNARIIITHGGPASFIMPLQLGKVPIVVPRQVKFNEHVNDHQLNFVKMVTERMGMIIPVYEIEQLKYSIDMYDDITISMKSDLKSNNKSFNIEFEKIVNNLFK